jgi:hypothetical protein
MELLIFVERLRRRPLEMEQLRPETFRSIDSLYKTFFAEGAPCIQN